MVDSTNLLDQWPHCQRADIKDTLAKGPLVYRILAVASTLETLEREESLLRANMHACRTLLQDTSDTEWHEQKRAVLLQLRSFQLELDRILTLKERARKSLPEIDIVTDRDYARAKAATPPTIWSNPLVKLFNLITVNFRCRNCA
jgi:hypothetical protein